MNKKGTILVACFLVLGIVLFVYSCDSLTEVNKNPNGVSPSTVNPNLIMSTVLTKTADRYLRLGYGTKSVTNGAVQQIQKTTHYEPQNYFQWDTHDWGGYYQSLNNDEKVYERAEELGNPFIMGISLTMRAFNFGLIADLWGPAPYSAAINGSKGGNKNLFPAYDSQKKIYMGVIDTLKSALKLFKNSNSSEVNADQDVYYHGDVQKWQRFANSLLLRYYMRLSYKMPDFAQKGMETVAQTDMYIKSNQQNATMEYLGNNPSDSWPFAVKFSTRSGNEFRRLKLCATFADTLLAYDDPRLEVWFKKVANVIKISASKSSNPDIIINHIRYIHPDAYPQDVMNSLITDQEYVGIPPAIENPNQFNLNPVPGLAAYDSTVSRMADKFSEPSGKYLKARLITAAEVDFILAEAANNGWNVGGSAKQFYDAGVKASLNAWGVGDQYSNYIKNPHVVFNGTLKQIITQKWIASFTMTPQSWLDWRRTGLPDFQTGPKALRPVTPVRFRYPNKEELLNNENEKKALKLLKKTPYTNNVNSQWSKPWVIQGTGEPWK
jgi:hypothetical protein